MSLRMRLVLLTVVLVAFVAVLLSAVQLQSLVDSLSQDTVSRAELAGRLTSSRVIERIRLGLDNAAPSTEPVDTALLWASIIANDPDIPLFLSSSILPISPGILEVNIANKDGKVLASSTPGAAGSLLHRREPFQQWSQLPWYRRAYDLITRRPDWEYLPRPIGIAGGEETVIQVQVVTSSFLARNVLLPPFEKLATVSVGALLLALMVAVFATASALRPLRRIESTIDRIVQGNFRAGETGTHLAKEFQAVESKLDLLGQQMLGAREKPDKKNLDVLLERMATQIDVAKRLSAISRLSSGVAHEIKNPLNAILLRLDLLKVRFGDSDDEVSEELNVLSKEVLRLNRVVTTFLDFSRPVEVHFEEVDLTSLARDVAELIRPQAALTKIQVDFEAPPEPAMMRGDPDLLKQAILNLVTNAVEAMGQAGGSLRIEVSRAGETWVLEVADSGPGIPPELRDKVFQLYFTSKAKGSGIGLAMTYRAAQLHNGTISFSSESGRGTTFRLEFPALVTNV